MGEPLSNAVNPRRALRGEVRPTAAYRPAMTNAALDPTREVEIVDHDGRRLTAHAASELALTVTVDRQDIVTLMTLGTEPELLVLGYLRNQRLIPRLEDIASISVDFSREAALVETVSGEGVDALAIEPRHRIVTTGCGQGTIYSCTLDKLYEYRLPEAPVYQSAIYQALGVVGSCNTVYRKAGSVHGCALVRSGSVEFFVEDVGRHNAMDTIAGHMWLERREGAGTLVYTTGRLTSEIVMKAAMMGVPALVSRNGITRMAVELGEDLGVMLVARAKSRRFQVFSCHDRLVFDAAGGAPH